MTVERYDYVIINRSFWPIYPVIGEGLLRLAEKLATNKKKIAVITQNQFKDIKSSIKNSKRGFGVKFFTTWALSTSSSNILIRILDTFFFMFFVAVLLLRIRPKKIYISTDPPVLVPFVVFIYSKIIKVEYVYHLQDIHPEATNVVLKINSLLLNLLKKIDNITIRNASLLITLNKQMKSEIIKRSRTKKKFLIIKNPSIEFNIDLPQNKKKGFSFTGNLGRVQRIPLVMNSIKKYLKKGGKLEFVFAGGGIYADQISRLSNENRLIKYYGNVSPEEAASISGNYEWALAPVEDKITNYSFPSKLSTYVCTGAKILAICGENTSVANWIKKHSVGEIVEPQEDKIVDFFFKIENDNLRKIIRDEDHTILKTSLSMNLFVNNLEKSILF